MRLMKVYSALLLLGVLCIAFETNAQAKIENDDYVVVLIDGNDVIESIRAHKTTSASGHIKISASFKLPEGHYLIPPKGWWPTIIRFKIFLNSGSGDEQVLITDEKVDIPHNGRFNVSLHLNGSGKHLPWGWYSPLVD